LLLQKKNNNEVDSTKNEYDEDKSTEKSNTNNQHETKAILSSDNYFVKKWRQSRLNKVWKLYGNESVAVCIGCLELLMLLLSFIKLAKVERGKDFRVNYKIELFMITFIIRFIVELLALILAVFQGKYLQIASSPLALEWQPSNYFDSMILCFLQFCTGIIAFYFALSAFNGYSNDVEQKNYHIVSKNEEMNEYNACLKRNSNDYYCNNLKINLCNDDFFVEPIKPNTIGFISVTIISAILFSLSTAAAGWIHYHKKTLKTGSKDVILFLFWARMIAIAWEGFGIVMDIIYIPMVAKHIDQQATSVGFLLALELLRVGAEVYWDVKGLKLSYAFRGMYVPASAMSVLKDLNTNRADAMKSNINIDSIVVVTTALNTSDALANEITSFKTEEVFSTGPATGGKWFYLTGGEDREAKYRAFLAIQPLADSDKAWTANGKYYVQVGETIIEGEMGKNDCNHSLAIRNDSTATRIVSTEVLH
jgi:hypothetical protein